MDFYRDFTHQGELRPVVEEIIARKRSKNRFGKTVTPGDYVEFFSAPPLLRHDAVEDHPDHDPLKVIVQVTEIQDGPPPYKHFIHWKSAVEVKAPDTDRTREELHYDILATINAFDSNSIIFVPANIIAEANGLAINEVEDHLALLEEEGKVRVVEAGTHEAVMTPKGRVALRERMRTKPQPAPPREPVNTNVWPEQRCPLCTLQATIDPTVLGDARRFDCQRCGVFTIGGSLLAVLEGGQQPHLILSGVTRNATEFGEELPALTGPFMAQLEARPPKTLDEKLNGLFELIRRKSDHHGQRVLINPESDYPLVYGRNAEEIIYCLRCLESKGWIEHEEEPESSFCALTPAGWARASQREVVVPDAKNVFVIHGRNGAARDAMFEFLRAVGLNPIEWGEAVEMTGKGSPYIGEILDTAFANAQAIVAVLSGDDLAHLRTELREDHDPDYEKNPTPQARPNVLFEAGMAFGRHPDRTIMVELGNLRPFSDVAGRHLLRFAGKPENRNELRQRLKTAGCAVKDAGTDWLKAGRFDEALKFST